MKLGKAQIGKYSLDINFNEELLEASLNGVRLKLETDFIRFTPDLLAVFEIPKQTVLVEEYILDEFVTHLEIKQNYFALDYDRSKAYWHLIVLENAENISEEYSYATKSGVIVFERTVTIQNEQFTLNCGSSFTFKNKGQKVGESEDGTRNEYNDDYHTTIESKGVYYKMPLRYENQIAILKKLV